MAAELVSRSPNVSRVGLGQPWGQQGWLVAALVSVGLVTRSPNVSRVDYEQPWWQQVG